LTTDLPSQARSSWLDALLDLDEDEQLRALADDRVPLEWRERGTHLCRLMDAPGVLDRDAADIVRGLLGGASIEGPESGTEVGRYRLERLIGEGGMATVWLARHEDSSLSQQVAVKCLRAALSTPEWRERFLREQRILSRLSHPNITRLLDAGITEGGTPYIAMEHVSGLPITEHCDDRGLDCRQRVRLFVAVCAAVAHAHRNLIVHRDLKPRNVLVDDAGAPRLLDFGIAKLLDPTDSDAGMTRTGLALLTPAYAAPEQFAHGVVTTATDVYGLGAMLYELLTGARAGFHDDGRLQLPSARVKADAGVTVASGGLRRLRAAMRGDLDAILQKAMRREPEQRYASATELGEDLERWLAGVAVRARGGNWRYRSEKVVRRHWLVLGLLAASLLGLSALTVYSTRESLRADRAAQLALREAERNRITRDFVIELLRDLRPGASPATPAEQLDRGERRARGRFVDDPESLAALLLTIGELDRSYGRLLQSRTRIEEAAGIIHGLHGESSALWLESEAQLAHTAFRASDFRRGSERLRHALSRYDAAGGASSPARIRALMRLGQLLQPLGERDEAIRLLAEASELAQRSQDPRDPLQQETLELYGEALGIAGRTTEAIGLLRRSLILARAIHGERDLAVVSALETLAMREVELGQLDSARAHLLEAQSVADALLTGPHVMAGYVQNSLGLVELLSGRTDAAQHAFKRALKIFGQLNRAPDAMLAATHGNLGEAAFERQDFAQAAAEFSEAGRQRDALKADPALVGLGATCLAGEAYARAGEHRRAIEVLHGCLDRVRHSPDAAPEFLGAIQASLADAYLRTGDVTAARDAAQAALQAPAAPSMHERLLPREVLARIAAAESDHGALAEHVRVALTVTGLPSRPCTVARAFERMRGLTAGAGEAALAKRLTARVAPASCLGLRKKAPPKRGF
jgi:serine/threonine-protein kinase